MAVVEVVKAPGLINIIRQGVIGIRAVATGPLEIFIGLWRAGGSSSEGAPKQRRFTYSRSPKERRDSEAAV